MTLNKHLYLCPPDALSLDYIINPWMKENKNFSLDRAMKQWENLVELYEKECPESVTRLPSKQGLTELCFFGDSVFAIKGKALFSRFATKERFPETDYVMALLDQYGIHGERVPEAVYFEGSGETMCFADLILVGYGQRSSVKIVSLLEKTFEKKVLGLELIDPVFYHLDTALFPISDTEIAYFPAAFSSGALEKLKALPAELIEVTKEEAASFALNSVSLGKKIVVHSSATKFINRLENRGYTVLPVDVSEFIKFGGGLKCLTFQHYL
jgi:N-dimethylarginine dimethylaminohydrolase